MADRNLLQDVETESADQEFCRHLCECRLDSNLGRIDRHADSEVSTAESEIWMVLFQSRLLHADELVCLSRPLGVAASSFH